MANTEKGDNVPHEDTEPAAQLLRPAVLLASDMQATDLSMSPKTGPTKAVSIAEPNSSPRLTPLQRSASNTPSAKQYTTSMSNRRLSGRPGTAVSMASHHSSKVSLLSRTSFEELPGSALPHAGEDNVPPQSRHHGHQEQKVRMHRHRHEKLLHQVTEWLDHQKRRSAKRKAKKTSNHTPSNHAISREVVKSIEGPAEFTSESDGEGTALADLQKILEENVQSLLISDGNKGRGDSPGASPRLGPSLRRPSLLGKKLTSRRPSKHVSSDTDWADGDVVVPSCDVVLDNSKTISSLSAGPSELDLTTGKSSTKTGNSEAWAAFKNEILKLTHTLRLKGWRRVPLDAANEVNVDRLSGALTNAVYVVSPPHNLDELIEQRESKPGIEGASKRRKMPPKLLLRIYGPQVEHLIDREGELAILRRLARKKIGPRMLGTFTNGRFEEYFASTTLTTEDVRVPETSKQIARRMRELHEGMELLPKEIEDGAAVWRNWDKWVDRCEQVVSSLDEQVLSAEATDSATPVHSKLKDRGFICGVPWPEFRKSVETYRSWLDQKYGGRDGVGNKLVFAHNDTQYGNILRLQPSTSSASSATSSHKQLIVIDFEYASANTRGYEFVNHFTEWCYNYHDPTTPHACRTDRYPTLDQQKAFLKAYAEHKPAFPWETPKPTPGPTTPAEVATEIFTRVNYEDSNLELAAEQQLSTNETTLPLAEDKSGESEIEREVEDLLLETRWWRMACSAQWIAWGIVQAPEFGEQEDSEGSEEFDYLAYSQERAMFYWGDCVRLGLVDPASLPEKLQRQLQFVEN